MGYNNYKNDFQVNEEKASEFLQNAVERITTEEDIDTLVDLIKIYKKNVPLSRRKYVVAYLLKEALKHYHSFGNNRHNNDRNRRRDERQARPVNARPASFSENTEKPVEERPRHPRVEIDPEQAASIFISIGKNRRVYPRDLVGILIAVGGIDRERIGDIKVLANYSFVQLYKEDAQIAIDKLNGYDYRGRKLAVSYSKQRSEDELSDEQNEAVENIAAPSFGSESISEEQMAAEDAAAYAAAEKAAADKEPFGSVQ